MWQVEYRIEEKKRSCIHYPQSRSRPGEWRALKKKFKLEKECRKDQEMHERLVKYWGFQGYEFRSVQREEQD